jgi:hypothetical protein
VCVRARVWPMLHCDLLLRLECTDSFLQRHAIRLIHLKFRLAIVLLVPRFWYACWFCGVQSVFAVNSVKLAQAALRADQGITIWHFPFVISTCRWVHLMVILEGRVLWFVKGFLKFLPGYLTSAWHVCSFGSRFFFLLTSHLSGKPME